MRCIAGALLLALFSAPASAIAAGPAGASAPGEDRCRPVVAKLQADCKAKNDVIQEKQKARNALAGDATKQAEADRLDAELQLLKADVCVSFTAALPQTCVALGSVLGGFVQTAPLTKDEARIEEERTKLDEEVLLTSQADRRASLNKGGTVAQVDPVESIQPITLAGGAFSFAGTRSGTKGVGTVTVNPLAIVSPGDVVAGRVLDVTVSAPFSLDSGPDDDSRYVSARLRANFTAGASAQKLATTVAAMSKLLALEGKHSDDIATTLSDAVDPQACAASIIATKRVTADACGVGVDGKPLDAARADLFEQMAEARREADSYYVGADGRLDTGDPTGTTLPGDKGTHVLLGLAAGRRFRRSALWDIELRGRFAGDYFRSRDAAGDGAQDPVWSVDWGVAFLLSGRLEPDSKQRMAFGVGAEGRHAANRDDAERLLAPTNYANINLMAIVPAADGGDLGLALSLPIYDSLVPRGASVVFSTDLGLLDHPH